jgi:hypothetical protein
MKVLKIRILVLANVRTKPYFVLARLGFSSPVVFSIRSVSRLFYDRGRLSTPLPTRDPDPPNLPRQCRRIGHSVPRKRCYLCAKTERFNLIPRCGSQAAKQLLNVCRQGLLELLGIAVELDPKFVKLARRSKLDLFRVRSWSCLAEFESSYDSVSPPRRLKLLTCQGASRGVRLHSLCIRQLWVHSTP